MSVCGIISPIVYLKILALTQLNVLVLFQGIKVTRNLPDLKYSLILRRYNTLMRLSFDLWMIRSGTGVRKESPLLTPYVPDPDRSNSLTCV